MSIHNRCRVKLVSNHCQGHDLCVVVSRAVPPSLRCRPDQPNGYGGGGSAACGCHTPDDLDVLVERQLRDNLQESRRRRFVLIRAA